jgi:hypothetical protein
MQFKAGGMVEGLRQCCWMFKERSCSRIGVDAWVVNRAFL